MTKEDVIKRKEEFLESIKDLPEEERKERINNFNKELDKLNTKSKDVLIATINGKGEIFCQTKSSKT